METGYNINNRKKKTYHFSQKFYIFIVCFFISSLFWGLIKLSRTYTEVLDYPVVYKNIPADKIIVSNPDSIFHLNLKSNGFKILLNKIFFRPVPIIIDVESAIRKKKNSKDDYFILTSELYQNIGKQINYENNVTTVKPDSIFVVLKKVYSKKIPVRICVNMNFAPQYEQSEALQYYPDSVFVQGPKSVIDTIKFIETDYKSISNIKSDQLISVGFNKKYADSKLKFFPSKENIKIKVEKYTEASVELPIIIKNNPNDYKVKTFPAKVKLKYLVSFKNYKTINPAMFIVSADFSKALASHSKKLKVEIEKMPETVKFRNIEPEKVEYLLIK